MLKESKFLSELILFVTRSGAKRSDELFSVRNPAGVKVSLTVLTVRHQINETCGRLDLPPNYFSLQSLRKGAVTHMRANGVSEDGRCDRGNHAPGS